MKKLLVSLFLITALVSPVYIVSHIQTVYAAGPTQDDPPTTGCTFDKESSTLCNPLPDRDLQGVIVRGLKYFLGIIGMVAVVMIVIGGFRMVMSQGNEHGVGQAKKTITWAVIGLIVAVMAYSLVAIVQSLLLTK